MTDLARALLAELDDAALDELAARLAPRLGAHTVDGWLSLAEAAEYLRCPRSRLYSLVSARRVPHERDGTRLLFRRSALDAWVRDGGGRRP
jgi:excisionase family DNA binding protein